MRPRARVFTGLALGLGGAAAVASALYVAQGDVRWSRALGSQDAVVLIITDNVREDHTSLCGYERPTTPTLEALAAAPGALHTCRAYAPGSWTLPSHASYFTGVPVPEHRAHEYDGKVANPDGTEILTKMLGEEQTTLAETMRERGYQTVLLAGNPIVGKKMGLAQGFDVSKTAKKFGKFEADEINATLGKVLADLSPRNGPLFLVVNLAEAHRPWKSVPSTHPFIPPRAKLQFDNVTESADWRSFLEGRMSVLDKQRFLGHITDVYDYGVQRADQGVADVLETVKKTGWCGSKCRILVTSDHGEFIGEHRLVDHGFYSWEENARVYLVAQGLEETALPEPLSATAVYWLARDGALPETLPVVQQWAWPHVRRAIHSHGYAFGSMSVARWTGWRKQLWADGQYYDFDLRSDPDEAGAASVVPADADFAALKGVLEAEAHMAGGEDEGVTEALKAAGYLE